MIDRGILIIVALVLPLSGCSDDSGKDTKALNVFKTPAWGEKGRLFVRVESEESGRLLLIQLPHGSEALRQGAGELEYVLPWRYPVYRYDPQKDTLDPVSGELWTTASTAVCRCSSVLDWQTATPMVVDTHLHKLRDGATDVATRGKYALASVGLKGRDVVAVLSADGPARGSIMPFLGRFTVRGQHYHEVLDVPSQQRVGEAVPIPLKTDKVALRMCASPDGRFVVYYESSFRRLCIVPVEDEEGKKP